MASRIAGAVLALIAAGLLVVAVVVTPWWSGHPTFNGAVIHAKEITITPLGARGCNTGGDGTCMNIPANATFETLGMATTGAAALLALSGLALLLLALREHRRRKTVAGIVIVLAIVAAGLAVGIVILGPQIRSGASVPLAQGVFVFFGGIVTALASSVFVMRTPEPRVKLSPARPAPLPAAPPSAPPALDVKALLQEDALRPSALGPEPKLGRGAPVVPSPGGLLPGPSGPLGAPNAGPQAPLFSSAPQLRPLYEMPGQSGLRPSAPMMPSRPPTPIPRDQVSAIAGIPTPPPVDAQRPVTINANSAPPAPPQRARSQRASQPEPPPPPPVQPAAFPMAPPLPQPPSQPAGFPMPPPLHEAPQDTDRDLLGARRSAAQLPKPRTLPPPHRPQMLKSALPLPPRAIPKAPAQPIAAGPPPPASSPNPTPASPPTADGEDSSFDAMQTYQRDASPPRPATPRPPTRLSTEDAAIDTDVSARAIDEASSGTFDGGATRDETRPSREDIVRTDRDLPTLRAATDPATNEQPPAPPSAAAPPPAAPAATPPITPTAQTAQAAQAVQAAPPAPAGPARESSSKLPISTADKSLPPPTEKEQATSGPSPACPQCEAPMAWVEPHLRFYCKSCKMYF